MRQRLGYKRRDRDATSIHNNRAEWTRYEESSKESDRLESVGGQAISIFVWTVFVSCGINVCVPMLRLKSPVRLVIVANLLLASLFFPTLHLHPIDDHAHDSDTAHRHGIVHSHFVVALAGSDNRTPNIHHDDVGSHEQGNEIALVGLTPPKVKGSDQPFQKQLYFLDGKQRQLVVTTFFQTLVTKPDSPPHVSEFYHLGSPRSPPRFA